MQTEARVVVIGGGVVGVSTLYHLAKKGWTDSVLLERTELTAGSTWHAAGLLPLFNMSYSVGQIHKYSVALYKTLEEETGQPVGLIQCGNLRLANTETRMDEYRHYAGTARTIGVNVEFLTPEEIGELWPLCNLEGLVGAIFHPEDGYIQPADVTMALAIGARKMGAKIHQQTPVTGIERKPSGEWLVKTEKGDIACEHVVSATGNYARQTGRMVGIDIPSIPVEHRWWSGGSKGCPSSRSCASPTPPITCARSAMGCSSALTRPARPRASWTVCRRPSRRICSRATSSA